MSERQYFYLEWGLLTLAAPFLLFPTVRTTLTLAALLALTLFWAVSALLRRPWPVTPFNAALLLFSIAVAVSILVTAWPEITFSKATGLLLGFGFFRAMAALRTRKTQRWGWLVIIGLGVGIAAVGLLSARFSVKIPVLSDVIARLPARLLTLPEGPEAGVSANQLAGVLAFYLPLALGLLWHAVHQIFTPAQGPSKRNFGGWIISLGFLVVALAVVAATGGLLAITQSRSGWIGGAGGLFALLWLGMLRTQQRWVRWVAIGLLFIILIGGGSAAFRMPSESWDRLWGEAVAMETEFTGRISLSGRVEIWSRALYAIQDFPFTGCGLGTFRRVVPLLYPLFTISPDNDIAHAHNIFLQTATDLGLPGLIAYLALLGIAAAVAWRIDAQQGLPLLAALIALHIYSLTDALALGSKPGIILWAALGLLAALAQESDLAE